MIGDHTGLDWGQYTFHDLIGYDRGYDPRKRNDPHVGDSFNTKLEFEGARTFFLGEAAMVRPYILAEGGAQSSVRVGTDIVIGNKVIERGSFWTRDVVTGQVLSPNIHDGSGLSFIAGFDVGEVYDSYTIPSGSAVSLEKGRMRARLGVRGNLGNLSVFFGQAWLGEDFDGQAEMQRVGSLSISLAF